MSRPAFLSVLRARLACPDCGAELESARMTLGGAMHVERWACDRYKSFAHYFDGTVEADPERRCPVGVKVRSVRRAARMVQNSTVELAREVMA